MRLNTAQRGRAVLRLFNVKAFIQVDGENDREEEHQQDIYRADRRRRNDDCQKNPAQRGSSPPYGPCLGHQRAPRRFWPSNRPDSSRMVGLRDWSSGA